MAGHVDCWDVEPAVFYNLKDLSQGDEIQVTGEDGTVYTYALEWSELYTVADLTPEDIDKNVGPTEEPALTLIPGGGAFVAATGEYLERFLVRAWLTNSSPRAITAVPSRKRRRRRCGRRRPPRQRRAPGWDRTGRRPGRGQGFELARRRANFCRHRCSLRDLMSLRHRSFAGWRRQQQGP